MDAETALKNSVIIVAHPDDEVLWFGSIVADVDRIIVAYEDFWAQPQIGAQRREALENFPRSIESLKLSEAGGYGLAGWPDAEPDAFGLAFGTLEATNREIVRQIKSSLSALGIDVATAPAPVRTLYEENFHKLADALRPRLSSNMNVFTHNPWGEYGHEDHVQLFRVLDMLRQEIGFTLWMSHYCTERALRLATRYFDAAPGPVWSRRVNRDFSESVADVYRNAGCWTWDQNWAWFETETFRIAPSDASAPAPHRHLGALNLFQIDG